MSLSRACCERATDACCPRSLMSSHRRRDDIVPSSPHSWSKHPGFVECDEEKRALSLSLLTHLPTYQPTYQPTYLPILSPSHSLHRSGTISGALRRTLGAVRAAGTLSPLLSRSDGSSLLVESSVSSGRFSRRFSVSPTISTSRCRGLTRYKHVYGHSLAP